MLTCLTFFVLLYLVPGVETSEALYINVDGSDSLMSDELFGPLTFDLNMTDEEYILTLTLLGSENYSCSFETIVSGGYLDHSFFFMGVNATGFGDN